MKTADAILKTKSAIFTPAGRCVRIEDAESAMHEFANQSRWIAVREGLPEAIYNDSCKLYEIRVIVSVKNKVFEGYFANSKKDAVLADFTSSVLFWQPLPDKPIELREEEKR